MGYLELEQFIGRGEEKLLWLLSIKNIAGLFGGGYLAHRLATVAGLAGAPLFLCMLLGAILGVMLTVQRRGILTARRLVLALRFYLRRATAPRILDAAELYEVVDEASQTIRVRTVEGAPILTPRQANNGRGHQP